MKFKSLVVFIMAVLWVSYSFAAGSIYSLRVDGLACPFCAYGIEKKLKRTEGVESVDIDLKNGLVVVRTTAGRVFTEDQLRQLVEDAGFSMKSMTEATR